MMALALLQFFASGHAPYPHRLLWYIYWLGFSALGHPPYQCRQKHCLPWRALCVSTRADGSLLWLFHHFGLSVWGSCV